IKIIDARRLEDDEGARGRHGCGHAGGLGGGVGDAARLALGRIKNVQPEPRHVASDVAIM
ncbi:hypothetical protein RZS08_67310, partial [Arthrospira platensis SPKY1]|nr:hypothetical protein [Arthrospira platensis SPKY1]